MPINETWSHAELRTFRATTGGAYNIIGAYGVLVRGTSFPTKGAIPVPTGKTGTIISTGVKVRGTGTLFLSQMKQDDFLYQQDVVRKIKYIESDTMLTLEEAFPTDISSGQIPLVCESQFYKAVYWKNTGAAAAVVQEAPLGSNSPDYNGGSPISYDTTAGGTLEFTMHK